MKNPFGKGKGQSKSQVDIWVVSFGAQNPRGIESWVCINSMYVPCLSQPLHSLK